MGSTKNIFGFKLQILSFVCNICIVNVNYEQEGKTGIFSVKSYKNAYVTHAHNMTLLETNE